MTTAARGDSTARSAKYQVITEQLREFLRPMQPGTRLDPERVLAERFGVSRMTVRQALDVLQSEGWLERMPGRGTFVRRPIVNMGPRLTSFTEDMQAQGLRPSSHLLGFDVRPASTDVASALLVEPGDDVVWMERLRLADDEPICLEVSHFPGRLHAVLERGDVEGSIHALLREAGLEVVSLVRQVCARAATERAASLLRLRQGAPALEVLDVFADGEGRPLQYAASLYRPERYVVTARSYRNEGPWPRPVTPKGGEKP